MAQISSHLNTPPLVSIIVPVYQAEKYLKQCLDSLVNQTLREIEIICVDDGSTDSSPEILATYAACDPRIKVITQPNSGTSVARNVALAAASAPYITFADNDDWIEARACEVAVDAMEKDQSIDLVVWRHDHINQDGQPKKLKTIPRYEYGLQPASSGSLNLEQWQMYVWDKLFKREIIEKFFIQFPDHIGEDSIFCFCYYVRCQNIYLLSETFYHYRQYSTSQYHAWVAFQKHSEFIMARGKSIPKGFLRVELLSFILNYASDSDFWYDYKEVLTKKLSELLKEAYGCTHNLAKIQQYLKDIAAQYDLPIQYFKWIDEPNELKKLRCPKRSNLQMIFSLKNAGPKKVLTLCGLKLSLNRNTSNKFLPTRAPKGK